MSARFPPGLGLFILAWMNRLFDRRRLAYVLLSALALALATQVGASCDGNALGYGCVEPDLKHHDQNGEYDPCHCDDDVTGETVGGRDPDQCIWCGGKPDGNCVTDGGASDGPIEGGPILTDAGADGAVVSCTGQCWPNPPMGWSAPGLLWFGSENNPPPCPDVAPTVGYEGKGGLDAPAATCGACSCVPPTGSCMPPTTITVGNGTCSGTSTNHLSFDPPTDWNNGACSANMTIPTGALCNGAPCVQSVTFGPLTMTETGCAPLLSGGSMVPPPTWSQFARSCTSNGGMCASLGEICGPPPSPGFQVCIFQQGDMDCPSFSPYSEKHVFYQGVDDTRGCSPCTCSSPLGSTCSATASIYSDLVCNDLVKSVMVDAIGPHCVDVLTGAALGGKAVELPVYTAGQCQPGGGAALGAAAPIYAATFCCLSVI